MTQKKIAIIGECMIELSEKGENIKRGFGGDTLNTAVYLARQVDEQQLRVDYVTALGTDSFSDQMIAAWQQEKVGTRLIQRLRPGQQPRAGAGRSEIHQQPDRHQLLAGVHIAVGAEAMAT